MRLLREAEEVGNKPRYLFIENVKNLLSVNEGWDFFNLLYTLDEVRYDAEWQLANSKHFGVPQNRERVYIIGHIRGGCTRKVFPITGCDREVDIKFIGNVMPTKTRKNPNQGRVYDTSGVTPALTKMEGGGRQPFITVKEATKQGYAVAEEGDSINLAFPDSKTRRGRVGKGVAQTLDKSCNQRVVVRACLTPGRMEKRQNGRRFKGPGEPMFTLTKQDIHGVAITYNRKEGVKGEIDIAHTLNSSDYRGLNRNQDQTAIMEGVRIRRLTPRECWRLQAVEESIIDKVMAAGISDTQMYKGAGDACTVNVIYEKAKKF
jgi:DNA (cytosine-5)-methyltransferase 1